jgi:hypothetical protein
MSNLITIEDLQKRPLSYSSLCAFAKSPAHFIEYRNAPKFDTPAFLLGGLVDCMLLTPERTEKEYAVAPICDRRTKEGKEIFSKFMEENGDKKSITADVWANAERIVAAVKKNGPAGKLLLSITQTQKQITFTDKETGLPIVTKLDMINEALIADLKTTPDASPDEFPRSCWNWDYHLQAGIYTEAVRKTQFKYLDYYILAAEKEPPYACAVFKTTQDFVEAGIRVFHKLLQEFDYVMKNNLWELSYDFRAPLGYYQLDLPYYAKKQTEE